MRNWTRTAIASGVIFVFVSAQADAAIEIGEPLRPNQCSNLTTYLQPVPQYTVPADGVITSWSYQSLPPGSPQRPFAQLKVGRAAGPRIPSDPGPYMQGPFGYTQNWKIVGESELMTDLPTQTLNTFPIRLSVREGDVLGIIADCHGFNNGPPGTGLQYGELVMAQGNRAAGTTAEFRGGTRGEQLDIGATFEADCPKGADADSSCDPPNTKITEHPANETGDGRVRYEFKSDEPIPSEPTTTKPPLKRAQGTVSKFECRLDRKAWRQCSSPSKVKVKGGKHLFEVRAIDAAGNRDPKPAKDRFEVVG